MKIEFSPIVSFNQINIAASIMEMSAMANGTGLVDDFSLDEDELLSEMKADPAAFQLEGSEVFLKEEEFAAKALAKEIFVSRLSELVLNKEIFFDVAYPFECSGPNPLTLTLKKQEERHPVGMAIIALSLFCLWQEQNISQVTTVDRREFTKLFAPLFELISTYALAGDVNCAIWWTGKSRSREAFSRKLNSIIEFVGSGTLKNAKEMEENQLNVNDGGIDGISISTVDGKVQADAVCTILGATIQHTPRRNKIVGNDAKNRVKEFFKQKPNLIFNGLLAVPFPESISEAQDCKTADCRYMPLETIEALLVKAALAEIPDVLKPHRTKLDKQMAVNVRDICENLTLSIMGNDVKFSFY